MRTLRYFTSCLPFPRNKQDKKNTQAPEPKLNKVGYICTLQIVNEQSLNNEIEKMEKKSFWTATRVEQGAFKLYQQQTRTGLVFSESTPSLLATKKDMGSDYIPSDPEYKMAQGYKGNDRNQYLAAQMKKTIEQAYAKEKLESEGDEFAVRRPRVMLDKAEFDSKYAEMSARHGGSIADISSKFLLIYHLRKHIADFDEKNIKPFSAYEQQLMRKLTSNEKMLLLNTLRKLKNKSPS